MSRTATSIARRAAEGRCDRRYRGAVPDALERAGPGRDRARLRPDRPVRLPRVCARRPRPAPERRRRAARGSSPRAARSRPSPHPPSAPAALAAPETCDLFLAPASADTGNPATVRAFLASVDWSRSREFPADPRRGYRVESAAVALLPRSWPTLRFVDFWVDPEHAVRRELDRARVAARAHQRAGGARAALRARPRPPRRACSPSRSARAAATR